ncbi:tetratricopeptide repeat protein [Jannaschia sp. LMIT008]|uniref:tetratricopeptide repeat protein n=1 Tax=Jannaschia maritima TaxID=3032585 RepID=UPI00281261DC|nr:tetratricopeptide repeat protein [Jannaschia sp. LMIT008]
MRQSVLSGVALVVALSLAGCDRGGSSVADDPALQDMLLANAPPERAVRTFRERVAASPEALEPRRGLAQSLIRAGRTPEALLAWEDVVEHPDSTDADRVEYAGALVREARWADAKATLDAIPPTHRTFDRYRLEAIVADSSQDWDRADSFYDTALGLTTEPAGVLNNWGFSKLTRGDVEAAERLFTRAITEDDDLFTAKNNLVLARATRRNYALPGLRASAEERAQLMHTAALAAIRQGDVDIARNLLEQAIDTHPRHFEPAVRTLRSLRG